MYDLISTCTATIEVCGSPDPSSRDRFDAVMELQCNTDESLTQNMVVYIRCVYLCDKFKLDSAA